MVVSIRHPLFKVLAMYIVVAMVSFAPIASIQHAAQALSLKKLLVGGLVGAAGLLALGALAGPASAIGAAGCAGTGFASTLGGALGTLVSGVTGITAAMGTLSLGSMATLGLMLGGAALGVMGLMGTSFVAVPALICGAGLLAYFWTRSSYRYGQPYDQRFSGPLHDPFFDASGRIANRSQSGYQGQNSSGGFVDRVRSIFDRDRRDDSFFYTNRYVDQNGYIRQGTDFFGRMNQFLNGRNAGYGSGPSQIYGLQQYPYAPKSTEVIGDDSDVQDVEQKASETGEVIPSKEEVTQADLEAATEARKAAYQRLIKSMQNSEQTGPAAAVGTSNIQSEEVQQAIRDYKEADRLVKEITGRLQHREKQ